MMPVPRYIGPADVPVIKAAVRQMLQEGVPRTQIAERLMAEYVPHDDVARLIARFPLQEASRRYRHWHRALMVLTVLFIAWYVCSIIVMILLCVLKPSIVQIARMVFPFFMATAYAGVLTMMAIHLRRNDGAAYFLGTNFGVIVAFDCFTGALDGHVAVRVMFAIMALAGVAMSVVSFVLRRRLCPDLRLFSAPPKDAQGRYVFSDAAR